MRNLCMIAAALLLTGSSLLAQEESASTVDSTAWTKGLVGNVSLTQASYDNWRAGGENTMAFKIALDGKAERSNGAIRQTHVAQFAYGRSKTADQGVRKIDDLLRYNLALAYLVDYPIQPIFVLDARTQADKGFDYGSEPKRVIAQFLSPAYIVETLGFGYEPQPWLRFKFGAAAKQTVVRESSLRSSYGLDRDSSMESEVGVSFAALLEKEIVTNVFLKSEFDVFESFSDASHPDVRLKNLVQMKVNQYLNVNLEAEFFYDNDASSELQVRQTLGLGIGLALI